jgi:hypothetical protein
MNCSGPNKEQVRAGAKRSEIDALPTRRTQTEASRTVLIIFCRSSWATGPTRRSPLQTADRAIGPVQRLKRNSSLRSTQSSVQRAQNAVRSNTCGMTAPVANHQSAVCIRRCSNSADLGRLLGE